MIPPLDLSTWDYGTVPAYNTDSVAWMPINGSYYTVAQIKQQNKITGDTDYSEGLNSGEWIAMLGNGTVKGVGMCSSTYQADDNNENNMYTRDSVEQNNTGVNCWCRATGVDTNDDGVYEPVATTQWVTYTALAYSRNNWCVESCAWACGKRMILSQLFRNTVLGVTQ